MSFPKRFPPPGRMVDIGGCRLHLVEQGTGSPPVILEAGIAASSLSWQLVHSEIAKFTRVASYDRAGLGWSDPPSCARDLDQVVSELKTLLDISAIPPPYVFAAHSYGSMVVLRYASLHPSLTAGLVLVDPEPAREWSPVSEARLAMIRRAARLSRRGARLAKLGVVRACLKLVLAGAHRWPQRVARLSSGRGADVVGRLAGEIGKLPREVWPIVASHWSDPKSFLGMAAYLDALPNAAAALAGLPALGDLPIVVLSAADSTPERLRLHDELAGLSMNGVRRVVEGAGHWLQLDRPAAVIEAVREVLVRVFRNSGATL